MSKSIVKKTITNIKYSLTSQVVVLILGFIKVLLIPIFLGVESFGYWQIYVLYTAFVGIFSFGFCDGIYLKYGALNYSELPLKKIRSSIRLYIILLIITTVIILFIVQLENNPSKKIAFYFSALNIVVMGLYAVFIFILQTTYRIKEYSFFNALDKIIFLMFIFFLFVSGQKSFIYFIIAELFSKILSLIFLIKVNKELIFGKVSTLKESFVEFRDNINVGMQLMLANFSGMLVLGIGRIFIEKQGDINEFAYYSFGIAITNLILVGMTGLSLVVYPALKRLPEENYLKYFTNTNIILFVFNSIVLFCFFPIVYIVNRFFVDYAPMLSYLGILFAIALLQCKMQLLNNTYYKVLREERAMLKANVESMIIALILTIVLYKIHDTALSVALAAMLTMLYRVYASELYLRRQMLDYSYEMIIYELAMLTVFVLLTFLTSNILAFFIYLTFFSIYYIFRGKEFCNLITASISIK